MNCASRAKEEGGKGYGQWANASAPTDKVQEEPVIKYSWSARKGQLGKKEDKKSVR